MTDLEIQFEFGCPSISMRLAKMRLLFGFHFFKDAPVTVIDLITSGAALSASWFMALRRALLGSSPLTRPSSLLILSQPLWRRFVIGFMTIVLVALRVFGNSTVEFFNKAVR